MTKKPQLLSLQPLLNEHEVADLLGISVRTVQEWRRLGEGPPFLKLTSHKRGVVRYDPEDLRAYVVERRVRNTSQSEDLPQPEPSDTRLHRR